MLDSSFKRDTQEVIRFNREVRECESAINLRFFHHRKCFGMILNYSIGVPEKALARLLSEKEVFTKEKFFLGDGEGGGSERFGL